MGQRFGVLEVNDQGAITAFREKNDDDGKIVNGGFMVMEPKVFDYIEGDSTVFEKAPLEHLAEGQRDSWYTAIMGSGTVWIPER